MDLQPEGILATSANPEDVLQGLQAVAQDQPFHKLPPLGPQSLTIRERQVMRQVALGLCDDQIAWRLGVSKRTVYNWVSSLQEKLGLENRVELALYYLGLPPHCRGWRGV
jgi:DNA-binding NarL/FixJ family response regulator